MNLAMTSLAATGTGRGVASDGYSSPIRAPRGFVRASYALARTEVAFVAVLLAVLVLCGLAQVISRYVFDASLTWTEELARVLFIAGTFLGFSASIALRREIRVDVLDFALRPVDRRRPSIGRRIRVALDVVAATVSFAFAVFMLWLSWDYVSFMAGGTSTSVALRVPSWWLVAVLPLAFALSAFHYSAVVVEVLQGGLRTITVNEELGI